jgi:branched-chain amino acid transport system permease protein
LPLAFLAAAALGALLEPTLYRRMYARPHLDQVLFSIGLVFIAITAADYLLGSSQQNIQVPPWLHGRFDIAWIGIGRYRLFVVVVCACSRSRCSGRSPTRASAAGCARRSTTAASRSGLGLDVNRIFLATFVVGSGLAGLGGALGAEVFGLDPTFPAQVHDLFPDRLRRRRHDDDHRPAARRAAARRGRRVRQVLRAQARRLRRLRADDRDPAGAAAGPVRADEGRALTTTATPAAATAAHGLARDARWRWWELATLAALPLAWLALPQHALLLNEIAILALFALSLDLVLGYAGIVSLGHAAFFGLGAYTAALVAKHLTPDPWLGMAAAVALSALLGFATSFLVLRGSDLTRLMVTLGVALILYELANQLDGLTGGADGLQGVTIGALWTPFGRFEFDIAGRVAFGWSAFLLGACLLVLRRVVHSPFGFSLQALRDNALRAESIGVFVHARLVAAYTLGGAVAGIAGALLAQTSGFASLDVFDFHRSAEVLLVLVIGGTGYLWGGLYGAIAFKLLHDLISAWTPQYWNFWLGVILVVLVLVGRDRLLRPWSWRRQR